MVPGTWIRVDDMAESEQGLLLEEHKLLSESSTLPAYVDTYRATMRLVRYLLSRLHQKLTPTPDIGFYCDTVRQIMMDAISMYEYCSVSLVFNSLNILAARRQRNRQYIYSCRTAEFRLLRVTT